MQTGTLHSNGPYTVNHLNIQEFFAHCVGLKTSDDEPLAHEAISE